jgi:hypothetical protein
MPVPGMDEDLSLARRMPSDLDHDDVLLMARNPPVLKTANKMVEAQSKHAAKKETKRQMNAGLPEDPKQKNAAIRTAQKDAKEQRKAKWDKKVEAKASKPPKVREPKPEGTPKQPRPQPLRQKGEIRAAKAEKRDERKLAGQHLSAAADRMKKTADLPDRKSTHTVGSEKRSGRDVRQSVMLSHLNENHPLPHGNKGNAYPKVVKPYPNPNYERDTKAKGQYVLPKEGLKEYPIKEGSGWTKGDPGSMRTLTKSSRA